MITNSNCILSIIIPCFNHGNYIQEALDSFDCDEINYDYEVLIVDDGSTDKVTKVKLEELEKKGYQIIYQNNQGVGCARNNAISKAKGKYILSIDADNKISPDYIKEAIPLLENDIADIIYAQPYFFGGNGKNKKQFKTRKFDHLAVVSGNFADNCAFYKKEVWDKNCGYDTNMPYTGFEDWEFWIHSAVNGFRFHFIEKKLYYYRVSETSMISQYKDSNKAVENHRYIAKKHSDYFLEKLVKLSYIREKYEIDILRFPLTPVIYLLYLIRVLKKPSIRAEKKFSFYSKISK